MGIRSGVTSMVLLLASAVPALAQDQIRIVGSSTVFPFTMAVIERFTASAGGDAAIAEATGTGGGIGLFCEGSGQGTPDVTGASRPMRTGEFVSCRNNGVTDVTEIEFGRDGIVLANWADSPHMDLSLEQFFTALAAEVEIGGEVVANPYQRWSDISPELPEMEIQIVGPPGTSGTRDALIELVMERGCLTFPAIAALSDERQAAVCATIRADGRFVEAGEDDTVIVETLQENRDVFGIFGFSFLDQNSDVLVGNPIDGVTPSFETIADDSYPLARSLYLYVKNAHLGSVPGLEDFITEYTSDRAIGPEGYLIDAGLVPLGDYDRQRARDLWISRMPMSRSATD